MASPPPTTNPDIQAATTGARPIYTFWGSAPPPAPQNVTIAAQKRKRRKANIDPNQPKLFRPPGESLEPNVQLAEDGLPSSAVPVSGSKQAQYRKKRTSGNGEEAEMRDMARKTRPKKAENPKSNGSQEDKEQSSQAKNGDIDDVVKGEEMEDKAGIDRTASGTPSPAKRKRDRSQELQLSPESPRANGATTALPPPSSPPDIVITHQISSRHLLSRTASTSSKGAPHDPIDVDSKGGPRKLVFAADRKSTHSFFSRPASDPALPAAPAAVPTTAEETVKTESQSNEVKVHSFFRTGGPREVPGQLKDGWGSTLGPAAPYPRDDWVIQPNDWTSAGTPSSDSSLVPVKRRRLSKSDEGMSDTFWQHQLQRYTSEAQDDRDSHPQARVHYHIPTSTALHPAIASTLEKTKASGRDTWADCYRPRAASQVLGNEVEAEYLKTWLRTLSVGTSSKAASGRKIQRKVKRVKPQLFDGWIVDDIGLFGDAADESDDEEVFEEYEEPILPLGERPSTYPPLELRLTNAIVLVGECGVGKSATVYAAATELGWEVFEVNPGMGKRTGSNLMSWVGDVGKNHTVANGGGGKINHDKGNIGSFFAKTADDSSVPNPSASQGSQVEPIELGGEESPAADVLHNDGFRQSLILIDEADILFTEESSFWPAVISLIAESKRPVVLTCNDIKRIPVDQLPLQAVLHFQPPRPSLAIPYLQQIATLEGISDPSYAVDLYECCVSRPWPARDHLVVPNGNEGLPTFDLRRALMQMQLDRQASHRRPPMPDLTTAGLDQLARAIEGVSYADAFIAPRDWARMDVDEIDRHDVGPDDELGISALVKPALPGRVCFLPAYDYSEDMAETLVRLSGGPLPAIGDLHSSRVAYIRMLLPVLDPLIPLSSHLLPHASLFLNHLPAIRAIVEADDAMQAAEDAEVAAGGNRVNRKTGRAIRVSAAGVLGREKYGRYFDVAEKDLERFRCSALQ